MKRWTLAEMVRTDIFRRGVPWMLLIKRTGTIETDLNVKADQKACVALTGLRTSGRCRRCSHAWAWAIVCAAWRRSSFFNLGFFAFLARRKGLAFAAVALPLHLLYYCCCGLSVVIAESFWLLRRRAEDSLPVTPNARTDPGSASIPPPARHRLGAAAGLLASSIPITTTNPNTARRKPPAIRSPASLPMRIGIDGAAFPIAAVSAGSPGSCSRRWRSSRPSTSSRVFVDAPSAPDGINPRFASSG